MTGEFGKLHTLTMKAGADLSALQYHIMRDIADGTTNIASEAISNQMLGVLQNKPAATNRAATIGYEGISKVVAGGAVTRGLLITTNGSGRAANATSGDMVFGRALDPATTNGEVISALIFAPFKPADVA